MDDLQEKKIRTLMMRSTPRPLLFFDIEITKHCNLNCKSCGSLSCLADEEFLDIEEYEKDIRQLSLLSNGEMHHINILGGEPLLNPQISEIVLMTRKWFPHGIIRVITNGILLGKMNDDFWNILKDNDITLSPTRYPIKIDYDMYEKKANEFGVCYKLFGDIKEKEENNWIHPTMELSGDRNEVHSFLHCWQANNCSVLSHGRIYPCPVIPNIKYFNKRFNTKLYVSEKDSINIYKVKDIKEIMEFLAKPVPFCRYCNTFKNDPVSWGVTEKKITEWT